MKASTTLYRSWARHLLYFVGAALFCFAPPSSADTYPQKPIRMIVPFPPGGSADFLGRLLARSMAEDLGEQVVIENRGGAASNVGSDVVAKAAPDGYTLLLGVTNMAINRALMKKMPFDPIRDFAPVTIVATVPNIIVAHPSVPVDSLHDLIRLAKEKPDFVTYASAGTGSAGHFAAVRLLVATQARMVHVPYKGVGPATTDLLSGRVMVMFGNVPGVLQHVKAGKLKPLAVTGSRRSPPLPDVPTVAESGISGYENSAWYGILAPAKTPQAIVNRLNQSVQKFISQDEMRQRLLAADVHAAAPGATPKDFSNQIREDVAYYADLVKKANLQTVD